MASFLPVGVIRHKKDYKTRVETRQVDYKPLYRFESQNVEWIADHFLTETSETRGGALSSLQKMKIFLRYMGDPGFQAGVGEDIGVDQTTVSRVIHEVREKIMAKRDLWIKFPQTAAEVLVAKQQWQEKFSIPGVIGAVDCTHVRIPKPKFDGDEFINRKGYPSINVQATCNSRELFTSLDACWPGSVHDSRIFKASALSQAMKAIPNTILLGDSGYAITPWLITPYAGPAPGAEQFFNKVYARERVIIERCFGQVKRRFPILHNKVRTKLSSVPAIITCCVVLHNVAKYLNDDNTFPELEEDDNNGNQPNDDNSNASTIRLRQLGQQKRNEIAQHLFQNRR